MNSEQNMNTCIKPKMNLIEEKVISETTNILLVIYHNV